MTIEFSCSKCGRQLQAPKTAAGGKGRCPDCGNITAVPAPAPPLPSAVQQGTGEAGADRQGGSAAVASSSFSQTGVGGSATRPGKSISFEGSFAPSIALLPNECILDEFEAGFWDLGIVGHFLGYKRRLVLTTHRLLRFDKKIVDNVLEIVWLRSVKLVVVGQTLNGLLAAFGALIILGAAGQLLGGVLGRRVGELGAFSGVLPGLLGLGFGLAMIRLAFRKVMTVSTGEDKTGLELVRIRSDESKRFVDKIFACLARMSS